MRLTRLRSDTTQSVVWTERSATRAPCLDACDPDAADEVRPVKVLDGLGRVHGAVAMAQLQRDLHACATA